MINTEQRSAPTVRASSSERSRPHSRNILIITIIIITVTILPTRRALFSSFLYEHSSVGSIIIIISIISSHLLLSHASSSSSSSSDSVLAASSPCLCPVARPVARLRSPVSVSSLGREAHHPGQAYANGETASQEIPLQKQSVVLRKN